MACGARMTFGRRSFTLGKMTLCPPFTAPSSTCSSPWFFHDTPDPLIRYLRDRRLKIGLAKIVQLTARPAPSWRNVLIVCGGVGGEGTFLRKQGFRGVTVSELHPQLLATMGQRDPHLQGVAGDAENLPFGDGTFDLVVVQDGIHHLKNPAKGLTEMLRVARRAVLMIEPHTGLVARGFGTKIEKDKTTGECNFVFRWNLFFFQQVVSSYCVGRPFLVRGIRLWDHNFVMGKILRSLPCPHAAKVSLARLGYGLLQACLGPLGNMFIGVVVKGQE